MGRSRGFGVVRNQILSSLGYIVRLIETDNKFNCLLPQLPLTSFPNLCGESHGNG